MEKVFINPYVLAGGGELNDMTSYPGFGHSTYHTFTAEAGIGLLTGLGRQDGSTRVQLRTEAKYRMEFASPETFGVRDPSGVVFGLGVQMNFGAPDDRPPKIVTHETVREVVREVQAPPPPPSTAAAAASAEGRHSAPGRHVREGFSGPRPAVRRGAGYDHRFAQAVSEPGHRGARLCRQHGIAGVQPEAHPAPGRDASCITCSRMASATR